MIHFNLLSIYCSDDTRAKLYLSNETIISPKSHQIAPVECAKSHSGGGAMDPPTIWIHGTISPPINTGTHARHALHTWIVRFPLRPSSVSFGFDREPMPTTCSTPSKRVPRVRPVRSFRTERVEAAMPEPWDVGQILTPSIVEVHHRDAINANLSNTLPLWIALIALACTLLYILLYSAIK